MSICLTTTYSGASTLRLTIQYLNVNALLPMSKYWDVLCSSDQCFALKKQLKKKQLKSIESYQKTVCATPKNLISTKHVQAQLLAKVKKKWKILKTHTLAKLKTLYKTQLRKPCKTQNARQLNSLRKLRTQSCWVLPVLTCASAKTEKGSFDQKIKKIKKTCFWSKNQTLKG